jgi:hypothetical protein
MSQLAQQGVQCSQLEPSPEGFQQASECCRSAGIPAKARVRVPDVRGQRRPSVGSAPRRVLSLHQAVAARIQGA